VAWTLVPLTRAERPVIASALAKLSFEGIAPKSSSVRPFPPPLPAIAIWYAVPACAVNSIRDVSLSALLSFDAMAVSAFSDDPVKIPMTVS
jgi:hypothetical protein